MTDLLGGLVLLEDYREGEVRREARARQEQLARTVCVVRPVASLEADSVLLAPLRREAQALSELDHPGIVRVLDLRQDKADFVLLLEDLLPTSLKELPRLDPQATLDLALALAEALGHAQSRAQVHGGLTLSCVRFSPRGTPKLLGFAQHSTDNAIEPLQREHIGGLSPETTIGQNPSSLSDLFALGALVYEVLSGKPPFGPSDAADYPSRVRNHAPEALLRLSPEAPAALRSLIDRCLSKTPAERPANARELADSLRAAGARDDLSALRDALAALDLLEKDNSHGPDGVRPRTSRGRSLKRSHTLLIGLVIGALLASAGALILSRKSPRSSAQLSLASAEKSEELLLRVVATPWAHVLVDGEHLETTPFARPLRLSPGRHIVRLEHPHSQPEERVINGQAGEAVLLDVRMLVKRPPPPEIPVPELSEDSP